MTNESEEKLPEWEKEFDDNFCQKYVNKYGLDTKMFIDSHCVENVKDFIRTLLAQLSADEFQPAQEGLDSYEIRKCLEDEFYNHHKHCKVCRSLPNKIDRAVNDSACCCGLFIDLSKAVEARFGASGKKVKLPKKRKGGKCECEQYCGSCISRANEFNEAIDLCRQSLKEQGVECD